MTSNLLSARAAAFRATFTLVMTTITHTLFVSQCICTLNAVAFPSCNTSQLIRNCFNVLLINVFLCFCLFALFNDWSMETILLLLLAAKLLLPNDTNAVDSKSSSLISSLYSIVSGMVSICTTSPGGSVRGDSSGSEMLLLLTLVSSALISWVFDVLIIPFVRSVSCQPLNWWISNHANVFLMDGS